jgi:formate dehydrogenase assembly factor FdhD
MSLGGPTSGFGFSTTVTEECSECDHDTAHEATVELRTENPDSENASFSREPYRVSECTVCGHTSTERWNNA